MSEIDDLRRRLAAAERVCQLVGITAARSETDQDKALGQAWSEWSRQYRSLALPVTDDEVLRLAARRDIIRNRTLARMQRESAERLGQECHATVLEAVYEQQHEPEVWAAHVWGEWRTCDRFPQFEQRDCTDEACRRIQTRHAQRGGA